MPQLPILGGAPPVKQSGDAAPPNSPPLCPSARCVPGAILLGIVNEAGQVAFADRRFVIDEEFVEAAKAGRSPEKRFRFSSPCVSTACSQWKGDRCSVVDVVVDHVAKQGGVAAIVGRCDAPGSAPVQGARPGEVALTDARQVVDLSAPRGTYAFPNERAFVDSAAPPGTYASPDSGAPRNDRAPAPREDRAPAPCDDRAPAPCDDHAPRAANESADRGSPADMVIPPDSTAIALPYCSIRAQCRWFQQAGAAACEVCPLVITDGMDADAAANAAP